MSNDRGSMCEMYKTTIEFIIYFIYALSQNIIIKRNLAFPFYSASPRELSLSPDLTM